MFLPCRLTSGSATPRLFTRLPLQVDVGFRDTQAVDPTVDDVLGHLERSGPDVAHGTEHDRDAALQVETEQWGVALDEGEADEHHDDGEETQELGPEASGVHDTGSSSSLGRSSPVASTWSSAPPSSCGSPRSLSSGPVIFCATAPRAI